MSNSSDEMRQILESIDAEVNENEFGQTPEVVNEDEVTAEYDLDIETYEDGEVHVMIKVSGTDQTVLELTEENWQQLVSEYKAQRNKSAESEEDYATYASQAGDEY